MKHLVVTAAIIERDGRILVTRRQPDVHLAGLWEFPGGKCDQGESLEECLSRELREELGISAAVGEEVFVTTHAYPERTIELHFLRCTTTDDPLPQLGQEMRWVEPAQLQTLEFPAADFELIQRLTADANGSDVTSPAAPSTKT